MTSPPGGFTLADSRVFRAARPVVFAAFRDPTVMARWWGPEGFTVPGLQFEPRVGATYRIAMQPPAGEAFFLTGVFREVDPPARLVYTFMWEDPDPDDVETLVTLSFEDLGAATRVALTQAPFRTEARYALHREGWADSLDKLELLIPALRR